MRSPVAQFTGAEPEDVRAAEARDGPVDDSGAAGADTDVASHLVGQPRGGRLAHLLQRPSNSIVGRDAEEGRLSELDRQALTQRLVEHRIARRIREVGQHQHILVRQRFG
jgi:hypothetical protein